MTKRTSESLLREVINQIPDVFVLKDKNGNFLLCNQVVADLYGTTPENMVGKHDDDFGVPKEIADGFRENVLSIMEKGQTEIVYEDSMDADTGELRHFKSIKKPIVNENGENQIIVIAQDITDIINAQKRVKENEHRLKNVLSVIHEGVWDWHIPTGQVLHNKVWFEELGIEVEDTLSTTLSSFEDCVHPDDLPMVKRKLARLLSGKDQIYTSEHRMLKADGAIIYVVDRGRITERDNNGVPTRVIGSFKNISVQKEAEKKLLEQSEQLKILARTDILTSANNRLFMEDSIQFHLDLFSRNNDEFAIMMIDIDKFKSVNDNFGHEAGDQALKLTTEKIKSSIRKIDVLGRWGGEEFLVICPSTNTEGAYILAENIRETIRSTSFSHGRLLTCSIGVTSIKKNERRRDLLSRVDEALYKAKNNGRDRVEQL